MLFAYNLTKAQTRRGHEVQIIAGGGHIYPRYERREGFTVNRVFSLAPRHFHLYLIPYGVLAYQKIRIMKPDIVHGHDRDPFAYSILRKHFDGPPFFLHSHGLHSRWFKTGVVDLKLKDKGISGFITRYSDFKTRVWYETIAHRNADFIFVDCEALKDEVMNDCDVPGEKIHVVYNGFDQDYFKPFKSSVRESLGIPKDSHVLLMPSADIRKGLHVMLRAFETLEKRYKDLYLLILGTNRINIEGSCGELSKNVMTPGIIPHSKMAEYYNAADIVVLPTFYDTFAKTFAEGMACEKPIVSTNVSGVPEIVRHGKEGLLSNPGNYEQLIEAVSYLIEEPATARAMGRSGRRRVLENFTWEKVAERVEEGYRLYFESTNR